MLDCLSLRCSSLLYRSAHIVERFWSFYAPFKVHPHDNTLRPTAISTSLICTVATLPYFYPLRLPAKSYYRSQYIRSRSMNCQNFSAWLVHIMISFHRSSAEEQRQELQFQNSFWRTANIITTSLELININSKVYLLSWWAFQTISYLQ